MKDFDIFSVCMAYESGVGHYGDTNQVCNPYDSESAEFEAYALGIQQGRKMINTKNEAPRTSEWISVEDRLPEYQAYAGSEKFAHVLVCVNGNIGQGMFCNEVWEFMGLKNVNVTHWMPLPDPPEER